jgi:threonine synthase
MLPTGARIVCTVTGNGLKDPEWAISGAPTPETIANDVDAAAASLGLRD